MKAQGQIATEIVRAIERDICDRRGLRHEWERIDEDIQQEIRDTWRKIVLAALKES